MHVPFLFSFRNHSCSLRLFWLFIPSIVNTMLSGVFVVCFFSLGGGHRKVSAKAGEILIHTDGISKESPKEFHW